jgi:hypothetical protein
VAIAGTLLLPAVGPNLSTVHAEHYSAKSIESFCLAGQLPIERGQTGEIVRLRQ